MKVLFLGMLAFGAVDRVKLLYFQCGKKPSNPYRTKKVQTGRRKVNYPLSPFSSSLHFFPCHAISGVGTNTSSYPLPQTSLCSGFQDLELHQCPTLWSSDLHSQPEVHHSFFCSRISFSALLFAGGLWETSETPNYMAQSPN